MSKPTRYEIEQHHRAATARVQLELFEAASEALENLMPSHARRLAAALAASSPLARGWRSTIAWSEDMRAHREEDDRVQRERAAKVRDLMPPFGKCPAETTSWANPRWPQHGRCDRTAKYRIPNEESTGAESVVRIREVCGTHKNEYIRRGRVHLRGDR